MTFTAYRAANKSLLGRVIRLNRATAAKRVSTESFYIIIARINARIERLQATKLVEA